MQPLIASCTMDTVLFADSVEWCPIVEFNDILACGTYQQKESAANEGGSSSNRSNEKKRVGCIYILQVQSNFNVKVKQTLETAGILDMKWYGYSYDGHPVLGVVTAAGEVNIYKLIKGKTYEIELVGSEKMKKELDKELLGLSLDWSKHPHQPKLAVSDSHGSISLFSLNFDKLILEHHWNAHGYEAWITSFDWSNSSIVYSGGDDCLFKVFDVRCESYKPQLTSKEHGAGVTSLHCNPIRHQYLASGSYDESLRVWDVRNLKYPVRSLNLGGGIWRIKWDPDRGLHLATACMYNHFHIVADCSEILEVVSTFKENESIAYGIDFCHCNKEQMKTLYNVEYSEQTHLLAMCSFYDHKLFISSIIFNDTSASAASIKKS